VYVLQLFLVPKDLLVLLKYSFSYQVPITLSIFPQFFNFRAGLGHFLFLHGHCKKLFSIQAVLPILLFKNGPDLLPDIDDFLFGTAIFLAEELDSIL
jgi:hypothetical protein